MFRYFLFWTKQFLKSSYRSNYEYYISKKQKQLYYIWWLKII